MKRSRSSLVEANETQSWASVGDIPGFPFEDFEQLQTAVAARSFNLGVDALAAAQWADRFGTRINKIGVSALSVLVLVAAFAAVVAAFSLPDYWLLAALPAQAFAFYVSHPASPLRKWVTVGGALSIAVFINLLLNGWTTAATIVACAGLTFAAVRMAGFITNAAFRKALLADEDLFLAAYSSRVCTLRNNRTERVYSM